MKMRTMFLLLVTWGVTAQMSAGGQSVVGWVGTCDDPDVWRSTADEPPAGWNTDLVFDDSTWGTPVALPNWLGPSTPLAEAVWDNTPDSCSTGTRFTWLRGTFWLSEVPPGAVVWVAVDDDVDIFINGVSVVSDHDCLVSGLLSAEVGGALTQGENLIALLADDCLGGCHGVVAWIESTGCYADFDGDGVVGVIDFLHLLAVWGTDGPGSNFAMPLDVVEFGDFVAFLDAWGPCP
jgi:hypothetical protein